MPEEKYTRRDYRKEMTDAIIKELSQGTLPWQQPWPAGMVKERPRNDTTGTQYKGINQVSLEMAGYADPRWMTFKQAQKKGFKIKKGSTSRRIEYWNMQEYIDKEKVVNPETGETEEKEVKKLRPVGNSFLVFNAEDIEGIEPYYADLTRNLPEKELNERAEKLIQRTGARIMFDSPGEAFYDKYTKVIHASPRYTYKSTYDMYSSILHQLAHWTSSKMDRKVPDITEDKEGYMREELRVELACYFLAHDLGIGSTQEHIKSHASYIAPWVKMMKLNKNEIYHAAREAHKIYDFLMDYVPEFRLTKKKKGDTHGGVGDEDGGMTIDPPSIKEEKTKEDVYREHREELKKQKEKSLKEQEEWMKEEAAIKQEKQEKKEREKKLKEIEKTPVAVEDMMFDLSF